MAAKLSHVHKYLRDKIGKMQIYKCALPGCPHYVRSNLAVNRISVCWYCDAHFVMTKNSIKLKKPHCPNCRIAHNAKPVEIPQEQRTEIATSFLETILPKVVGE